MGALRRHAAAVRERLTEQGGSAGVVSAVAVEEAGCIGVRVNPPAGSPCRITLLFQDEDEYPRCGVLAMSDDGSEGLLDAVNARLEAAGGVSLLGALGAVAEAAGGDLGGLLDGLGEPGGVEAMQTDGGGGDSDAWECDSGVGGSGSEGEDGYEGGGGDSDGGGAEEDRPDEAERVVRLYQNKRQWEEREERRVKMKAEAEEGTSGGTNAGASAFDLQNAARRQIFTSQACFRLLSQELFRIQEASALELGADAVDYDVHHWHVSLGDFGVDTPLGQDLLALHACFGYGSVQLRLRFKEDLYPFYPPSISLVRPRLQGVMQGALLAHPRLHLNNWEPFKPCTDLIAHLRDFLERFARVDLECEANDAARFPEGAYSTDISQLESSLAQLAANTMLLPPVYARLYEQQQREFVAPDVDAGALPADIADLLGGQGEQESGRLTEEAAVAPSDEGGGDGPGEDDDKKTGRQYWKKGTGYGHDDGTRPDELWDAAASKAAQVAQDDAIQALLRHVTGCVSRLLGGAGEASPAAARAEELMRASSVVAFLRQELNTCAFINMCARVKYYSAMLELVQAVSRSPCADMLWAKHPADEDQVKCAVPGVLVLVERVVSQAQLFLRSVHSLDLGGSGTTGGPSGSEAPDKQLAKALASTTGKRKSKSKDSKGKGKQLLEATGGCDEDGGEDPSTEEEVDLANLILRVGQDVSAAHAALGADDEPQTPAGASVSANVAGGSDPAAASDEAAYHAALAHLQLECLSLRDNHHYNQRAQSEMSLPRQIKQVGKESSGLSTLLPLNCSSSIFVRVDEQKTVLWRALITGPEDTPYSGGCFIFDIYFPPQYPNCPPHVNMQTTGGGSVRFNPNLYNNGKVCLSLLGTWHGAKGEGWDPAASTMLQVLISIQSLIFVAEPYFNEPGFERSMGTAEGDRQSKEYSFRIRESTIRLALIDQLRHPRAEFAEVIKAHFTQRKEHILKTCAKWVDESAEGAPDHQRKLKELVEVLKKELNKL